MATQRAFLELATNSTAETPEWFSTCSHLQMTGYYRVSLARAEHTRHGMLLDRPFSALHIRCEACILPTPHFAHSIGVIKNSQAPRVPPVNDAPAWLAIA